MAGRKPDYRVAALDKDADEKSTVGAAWKNDGSMIAIVLNDFVVLPKGGKHLLITLFPANRKDD